MTTWVTAIGGERCGGCLERFTAGEPIALLTDAKLRRCLACAERLGVERLSQSSISTAPTFARVRDVAQPIARAVLTREPGEEG